MLFMSCVCHAFASVHCWTRADLLALISGVNCVLPLFDVISLVGCGT